VGEEDVGTLVGDVGIDVGTLVGDVGLWVGIYVGALVGK